MSSHGVLSRASGFRQAVNRSRLLEVARSPAIIAEIVADRGGYVDVQPVDWDAYWHPHVAKIGRVGCQQLAELQKAREAYLASGFKLPEAARYCYCYFRLLRLALRRDLGEVGPPFLQALAGLETFGVRRYGGEIPEAAGVLNIRHPVYLLARLRWPRAMSDPKFLPLVCLPPTASAVAAPPGRFYHYRQVALDGRVGMALLVYPVVALAARPASFERIECLTEALRSKPDPWSGRRARLIADRAIAPFLARRAERQPQAAEGEIALADIGGGTGILVSQICKRLLRAHRNVLGGRAFAWSFIDLSLRDPARHARNRWLRNAMSVAEYIQADYKPWVLQEARRSASPTWHVALLCRLLNNLSTFTVEWSTDARERGALGGSRTDVFHAVHAPWRPTECLCPSAVRPSHLRVSNGQVEVRGGRSMRQLSLTDYFEALHSLASPEGPAVVPGDAVFFPLRRFDPGSLVLADGSSLLEQLCTVAELAIIEDVDLTPQLLKAHLDTHGLDCLAASDATDPRRMHSAYLLCVANRCLASCLPGRRIW
ncbi:MAG TPA: hypothetical protein VM219_06970 [Phycisphaerae bacterium]|nr:hypothetical protein [Phycisphaerae bacterium]